MSENTKVVAHFYGRVNTLNQPPEPSYVTLKDAKDGKTVDTDAVSEKLLAAGIDHAGCEFEVFVEEAEDGKVSARMVKVEPNFEGDGI